MSLLDWNTNHTVRPPSTSSTNLAIVCRTIDVRFGITIHCGELRLWPNTNITTNRHCIARSIVDIYMQCECNLLQSGGRRIAQLVHVRLSLFIWAETGWAVLGRAGWQRTPQVLAFRCRDMRSGASHNIYSMTTATMLRTHPHITFHWLRAALHAHCERNGIYDNAFGVRRINTFGCACSCGGGDGGEAI